MDGAALTPSGRADGDFSTPGRRRIVDMFPIDELALRSDGS